MVLEKHDPPLESIPFDGPCLFLSDVFSIFTFDEPILSPSRIIKFPTII
jgi:hypothetical protein